MTIEQAMSRLLMIWPQRAQSVNQVKALTALYAEYLADLSPAALADAVDSVITDTERPPFFPTPGELLAARARRSGEMDLIAGARANRQQGPEPLLLPVGMTEEQAAVRRGEFATLQEAIRAKLRAASAAATATATTGRPAGAVQRGLRPVEPNPEADAIARLPLGPPTRPGVRA